MHPGSRAACGSSRDQAGVRSMGILPIRELARIPARDPAGDSGLTSPRLTGPRIKSQGKSCFALASARRTRALCSSRGPMALRRQRAIRPHRGRREGSRRFRCCTGCAISGTRPMTRTHWAGCPKGARRWGVFFWFLTLHERRKEPARRRRVEAFAPKNKTGKSKDAGFPLRARWNDEPKKNWIPASAGMTS